MRGTLDDRSGMFGRSAAMGLTLGVPGRGGAAGKELSRPDVIGEADEETGRVLSGAATGDGGAWIACADGMVGSDVACGLNSAAALVVAESGEADLRVAGGGGGVRELL
jgi:hypothetical protein